MIKVQKRIFLLSLMFILLYSFTMSVFAAPIAPTNLSQVSSHNNFVYIKWDKVNGAKSYYVEYSSDKKTWTMAKSITSESYTQMRLYSLEKLDAGCTYYVRVRSLIGEFPKNYDVTNEKAQEGLSEASKVLEVVTSPGDNVTGLEQVSASDSTIEIKWNKVKNATHYYIHKASWDGVEGAEEPKYTLLTTTDSTSIEIGGYSASEQLIYCVTPARKAISTDYIAQGSTSDELKVFTSPGQVKGLYVEVSNMNADGAAKYIHSVSWKNLKAGSYEIEYRDIKGVLVLRNTIPFSSSEIKLPVELRNKAFKFRVRACQEISNGTMLYGKWSGYRTVVPYGQIVKGKSLGAGKVRITWKKIEGATKYTVYLANKSTGKYKKLATTKKNLYVLKNIRKRKNYYVYVTANIKIKNKTYKTNIGALEHDFYGFRLKK